MNGDGCALRLSPALRERIVAELAQAKIGDTIEWHMFLAALDYQLDALALRLPTPPPSQAELLALCSAAVDALDPAVAAHLERICRSFVGAIAQAFDDCFETAPTADPEGPFRSVLIQLRGALGLPFALDPVRLGQIIGGHGLAEAPPRAP